MERGEPTLVPEWLRSTGNANEGGSSAHNVASSPRPDIPSLTHPTRHKSFKSRNKFDISRLSTLERSASSNSRQGSSNNDSSKHPYSSFGRSNRDREKDRSAFGDHRDFDPPVNLVTRSPMKDTSRHSGSIVSRKQADLLPQKVVTDLRNGTNTSNNCHNGNGLLSGGSLCSDIQKDAFNKDFPSLSAEERLGSPDDGRVPSPGLTSAVQSLPVITSALMGGESWSALVEVPVATGNNSMVPQLIHQSDSASPTFIAAGSNTSLNMAEALAQASSRARADPQISVETQRLEELAIRKLRQLIPLTPLMPKALINSSDKLKPKTPVRTGEIIGATKSVQQPPLAPLVSQTLRGELVKSEASKTFHVGKFLVLKPGRENGVFRGQKEIASPTNNTSNTAASSQLPVPSVSSSPRSPNNRKLPTMLLKESLLIAEKRPLSQAQSRSDFFNLMRKKTLINTSSVPPDSGSVLSSSTMNKSNELINEVVSDPLSPCSVEYGNIACKIDASEKAKKFANDGKKDLFPNGGVYPDKEEAAFLRSLGWDENTDEDEGLTEEEINTYYQELMKLRPSLKSRLPKLPMMSGLYTNNDCLVYISSSGSESEE